MKKFPKINKQKNLTKGNVAVKNLASIPIEDTGISFSFRYFKQIDNFGITGKDDVWMSGLLDQLRLLSGKNADELLSDVTLKDYLRMHTLDLSEGKSALSLDDFEGSGDRYLNHLYTNKKWHVKQERIQIAEPLAQKEKGGLLDIEEAPVKTYYSDEEIWHVITTETGQGSAPSPVAADHRCFF